VRYDALIEKHHHLYSSVSNRIEDYTDENLDSIIEKYFENKSISNFIIEDFKLQIIGRFTNKNKKHHLQQKFTTKI
jgi:Fur family transcriptional regulator, peroxide stress response regulator